METSWPILVNMYQSSTKFTRENSRSTFSLGGFQARLVGAHIPEGLDMHQVTKLSTLLNPQNPLEALSGVSPPQ